ncbi:hypothetical protein [Candidatus Nitrosotalea okcheonensis]|uniref:Uncharacterized protein n=1 Tax=Candidatus Nitrosotalea okcheonensis TaxID=1903276 RepID=A0A2H1FDY9_9ARCH|nr:hypothetical protein [Candidatus Nitrosotalea okcheonensis]SMH70992.1 conserved protein of unknown function [Candidatus Nitrosotalea okcheonensis]
MPLSERSLALLNNLVTIDCNETLGREQDDLIKDTFTKILSSGNIYKIDDIEKWLEASHVTNMVVAERILNVAHYQKAKHDARNPLKMARDDSCGCGGDC